MIIFGHAMLPSHINFSWDLINDSIFRCSIDQDDDSRAPHHRSNTMKKSMNRCVLLCRNQYIIYVANRAIGLWGVDFLAVTVIQYQCTIVSCFYVFFGMFSTKLQLPFDFLFGLYLVDRMLTPHFVVILHWPFCTQLRGISSLWKLTL